MLVIDWRAALVGLVAAAVVGAWSWRGGSSHVWVEDDGSVRALTAEEERYLATRVDPADSGRPYVKRSYWSRTPDGRRRGFLERGRVPPWVRIRDSSGRTH